MTVVVALHGFTGRGASWDAVAEHLPSDETSWRLVAPDLPGHGEHAASFHGRPLPTSFDATVDLLVEVLTEVLPLKGSEDEGSEDERQIVLAGYSLGARLALALLARRPELFDRAVLVGVRPGLAGAEEPRRRAAADDARAEALRRDGVDAFIAHWEDLALFDSQRALAPEILERQRAIRGGHDAEGLAWAVSTLSPGRMPPLGEDLSAVTTPVRVLVGALDPRFHEPSRAVVDALPRATLEIVGDAGHNLILEAPQAVAAAIQEVPHD